MKNVLVFPCGSEIGLELHRSLDFSPHFRLFGASSVPDHGRFVYARYRQIESMADDAEFPDEFNAILRDMAIDYVMPAHDAALVRLSEMQDKGELAAEAIVPGFEAAAICRSKQATYRLLGDRLSVPRVYHKNELDDASYPLFGKPDVGQGSRGAEMLPDAQSAREKLRRHPATVIMEYLPGPEYTVDCFTDSGGKLLFQSARARDRVSCGISVHSRLAGHPSLVAMTRSINDLLPMRGAWFFQARENAAGEAVLLEIAPRIAGASGFQRARGVNLPLLSLYDRMGLPLAVTPNALDDMEADRSLAAMFRLNYSYDAVYIDLDDTLSSFERGVNTDAVKLIFQCRNKGKRVVLITRHGDGLEEVLEETRLAGIFDEVIHIRDGASKADYITEASAVFIDDSYSERSEVAGRLGIPVFDPSSIEALMDRTAW